jgi:hypothetical protein
MQPEWMFLHHPDCPKNDPTRSNAPCLCMDLIRRAEEDEESRRLLRGIRNGFLILLPFWGAIAWLLIR